MKTKIPLLKARPGNHISIASGLFVVTICWGKQSKCGMIHGRGALAKFLGNLQKARYLWVLCTPQNNKEEGARAKKPVTFGTRGPLGKGKSVHFSAQGDYCSALEP